MGRNYSDKEIRRMIKAIDTDGNLNKAINTDGNL